jgi:hypothetical protein
MSEGAPTGDGSVGLLGAVAIGIGGMVGGGIFAVLGEAVALGHGGTPVAFALAGLVAVLTSYSYAHLSVAHPSRGGTITYVDVAFGRNLLSGSANVMLWLSYLVTIALYAVAFGSYAATFLPDPVAPLVRHLLVSAAIVLPAIVNAASASVVSRVETLVVVLKLALLGVVIAVGAAGLSSSTLAPSHWGSPVSLLVAGMVIFVAYEGFELIANAAEDVRSPATTLPRAYYLAVGVVVALYVVIAAITVSAVPEDRIAAAKDYALAVAAEPSLGHLGFVLVATAALLATLSAINATIYGNARLGYILATEGELPASQARKRRDIPVTGTATVAGISLLLANFIPIESIAIISSASFLLVFAIVNSAAVRLAHDIGARPLVVRTALALSAVALAVLVWHSARSDLGALMVFAAFLAVSFLVEYVYGRRVRGHFLGRPYPRVGVPDG